MGSRNPGRKPYKEQKEEQVKCFQNVLFRADSAQFSKIIQMPKFSSFIQALENQRTGRPYFDHFPFIDSKYRSSNELIME
jgi:hypothetical protein